MSKLADENQNFERNIHNQRGQLNQSQNNLNSPKNKWLNRMQNNMIQHKRKQRTVQQNCSERNHAPKGMF